MKERLSVNGYRGGGNSSTKSVLRADRVGRIFGKTPPHFIALQDVSFEVNHGEFIGLVGPSGCGKSTLLKIFGGLLVASEGTVVFDGKEVDGPREDIGLMFQTSTLFPWRSVVRNITLPLEIRKQTTVDVEEKVANVIDLVGLQGFENRYPRELSGGMQQRAALCRLLISDPRLMLLDEPFASVDEFTREHLNLELARITEHEDKTTVFVTHNIPEAVFLSDRVVVMDTQPGRVVDVLDINLPRPRVREQLGSAAYAAEINAVRKAMGLS